MARAESPSINPSHSVGNHRTDPFHKSDEGCFEYSADEQVALYRFSPASILDGVIQHRHQHSKRRLALQRIILAVFNRFKSVLARADQTDKGYTPNCLRHTFATDLLNAGMRLEEVTRIYARLSDATREEEYFKAMEKIEGGHANGYLRLDCKL